MKKYIAIIVLVFTAFALRAQDADSLWNGAVQKYSEGDIQGAMEDFLAIEGQDLRSAELFYNIGNCYYRSGGYLGKAVLYYERALREDPSFKDAAANLSIARQYTLDKIETVPEFVLVTWARELRHSFSSDTWAWFALAFFALVAVSLLWFRYGRRMWLRKFAFSMAIVFGLCCFSSLGMSLAARAEAVAEDGAVVISPVTSVVSSPGTGAQALFVLHEGTVLEVIDSLGQWYRVQLSDGRQGWLLAKDIEII
ncbi:MAG: SH3 domain-containing protein [Bacteroidales bacterium]|nr:SH3 domain-containing protein [Bacteroidales bacterium]